MSDDKLVCMLDVLLPGGDGFPPAGDLGLADWLRARNDFAPAVAAVLEALPATFAERPAAERTSLLQTIEVAEPEIFERLLVAAYSGYYVHPQVRAVIARETGYPGEPPQPHGYTLPPFDPTLLDTMRGRPRSYREA